MGRRFVVLIGIGLTAIALAVVARLQVRSTGASAAAAPDLRPAPPTGQAPAAQAAAPPGGVPASGGAAAPSDPTGAGNVPDASLRVRLGGWVKSKLPLCGRSDGVTLLDVPDGKPLSAELPSCDAAWSDFPSGKSVPILERRGEWIRIPGGWASIQAVRTAEVLVVDGVEYWHDLFNTSVGEVKRPRVTVKGDTDPCAGQICGDAHGLYEQGEMMRQQIASEYPDGSVPPEAMQEVERQIARMNEEAERSHAAGLKAAEERARQERTFEIPPPPPGEELEPFVESGSYMCCT
jgi:phage tail protein X